MRRTERPDRSGRLELWGGLECTVARVGDTFRDQLAELDREWDIERTLEANAAALRTADVLFEAALKLKP